MAPHLHGSRDFEDGVEDAFRRLASELETIGGPQVVSDQLRKLAGGVMPMHVGWIIGAALLLMLIILIGRALLLLVVATGCSRSHAVGVRQSKRG